MDRPARRRRGWLTLLGLAAVAAGGIAYATRPKPPLEVEVVKVAKGEVREMVASAAAGEVKPARRVTVRAEIAGTVQKVTRKRGERVTQGEVIVTFQAAELDARVAQSKANLEAAEVALNIAGSRRETAKRAMERARKLREGGAISDVDLERAETEHEALSNAVQQAEAAKKQALSAVELAQVARDRATVKAPFAGMLQEVMAEVGVQLAPAAPLFDLIDDASLHIDVPVDEADIDRISIGQKVSLKTDALRGAPLSGTVRFIPPAVGKSSAGSGAPLDTASIGKRDRSLYVEITPESTEKLRVGASVNAEFLVSARTDVLFVPSHVVIGRGIERSVYVVQDGKAVKRRFSPGITSWDRTEVVSGLNLGETVIASLNLKGLDDGTRVQPRGAAPAAETAEAR